MSFRDTPHRSGRLVRDPADEPELPRLVDDEHPETDALHAAVGDGFDAGAVGHQAIELRAGLCSPAERQRVDDELRADIALEPLAGDIEVMELRCSE